jgi:hypothetical protein
MSQPWQGDWSIFVETLQERIQAGDSPEQLAGHFGGKSVTWSGLLEQRPMDDPSESVVIGLTMFVLDLGRGRSAILDGVALPISDESVATWNALDLGCQVTFTATIRSADAIFPGVQVMHFSTGESVVMVRIDDGRLLSAA